MKTVKMIDLLNTISSGENIPREIKFYNNIYFFDSLEKAYVCKDEELSEKWKLDRCLNDEVEIIEDKKKIERIDFDLSIDEEWLECEDRAVRCAVNVCIGKINKIIDKLNCMEDKRI